MNRARPLRQVRFAAGWLLLAAALMALLLGAALRVSAITGEVSGTIAAGDAYFQCPSLDPNRPLGSTSSSAVVFAGSGWGSGEHKLDRDGDAVTMAVCSFDGSSWIDHKVGATNARELKFSTQSGKRYVVMVHGAAGARYEIELNEHLVTPDPTAAPTQTATPRVSTCSIHLPEDIWAADYHGETHCNLIDAGGIGIQSVIDAGIIRAVDVWGFVAHPFKLCFRHRGIIKFLDASTSPRTVTTIPYTYDSVNVLTCAAVARQGTVVLAPGDPPESPAGAEPAAVSGPPPAGGAVSPIAAAPAVAAPAAPAAAAPAAVDVASAQPLTQCELRTVATMLRFRRVPWGGIIGLIPFDTWLNASKRASGWYQVLHQGKYGWISGDWVTIVGACS